MPNHSTTLQNTWAQNVNKLWIQTGLSRVYSSTFSKFTKNITNNYCVKSRFSNNNLHINSTSFYTPQNRNISLLIKTFTHNPQPLLMRLKKET